MDKMTYWDVLKNSSVQTMAAFMARAYGEGYITALETNDDTGLPKLSDEDMRDTVTEWLKDEGKLIMAAYMKCLNSEVPDTPSSDSDKKE